MTCFFLAFQIIFNSHDPECTDKNGVQFCGGLVCSTLLWRGKWIRIVCLCTWIFLLFLCQPSSKGKHLPQYSTAHLAWLLSQLNYYLSLWLWAEIYNPSASLFLVCRVGVVRKALVLHGPSQDKVIKNRACGAMSSNRDGGRHCLRTVAMDSLLLSLWWEIRHCAD